MPPIGNNATPRRNATPTYPDFFNPWRQANYMALIFRLLIVVWLVLWSAVTRAQQPQFSMGLDWLPLEEYAALPKTEHDRAYLPPTAGRFNTVLEKESQKDLEVLLAGVASIDAPGVPGPIAVFGEDAFPIVSGMLRNGNYSAVVAGARAGHGRIIVFGHGGYFRASALANADTGRLIKNAIAWSAGEVKSKIRVGITDQPELYKWALKNGLNPIILNFKNWSFQLKKIDVLIAEPNSFNKVEVAEVRDFINRGGGFIAASLGWGWSQLNPQRDLATEHGGNLLLAPFGLSWANGYMERTSPDGFDATKPLNTYIHGGRALDAILLVNQKGLEISPREIRQIINSISQMLEIITSTDTRYLQLLSWIDQRKTKIPTAEKPFKPTDNLIDSLVILLQVNQLNKKNPDLVTAHPASTYFPGTLPSAASRITKVIEIDTSTRGWHSTGLYAAPGDVIKVKSDKFYPGLSLRIGAHSDDLSDLESWSRMPQIVRSFNLKSNSILGSNAFGGLIYIDVDNSSDKLKFKMEISGGVEAPLFVLGKTTEADWLKYIRNYSGPWAEIATSKVILTIPSQYIRKLENPKALAEFWDRVLDSSADLAAIPRNRNRPERYVTDIQISVGYMHSGYPIMTHLDAAERMVNLDLLKTVGDWGLFHELGHNHQSSDWTFIGTTEVTVNIFTMYIIEQLVSDYIPMPNWTAAARENSWIQHRRSGSPYEKWKADPFLALIMYRQLIDAFGWDLFKRVFAEYRTLPPDQRPQSDIEKRDQWLIRLSRNANRNFSDFFDAWGVPTSKQAKGQLAELPIWMPK